MGKRYKKKDKNRILPSLPPSVDCNREKFTKFSFFIRRSDISSGTLPCIWSIENHVLIVKWVPMETNGHFQITNRYCLWNSSETYRYIHLHLSDPEILEARESGKIKLDSHIVDQIME